MIVAKFVLSIALVIGAVFMIAAATGQSEAMTECQKTHSYDSCFQMLNR